MLFILLPAYNEGRALPTLLQRVSRVCQDHNLDYRVVVVDDGSTDDTAKIAEAYRQRMAVSVLRHPVNMGLGKAIRTGMSHFSQVAGPGDVLVTMDADDTHDPKTILAMMAKAQHMYDVVIASRYAPGGEEVGLSILRRVLSRGASALLRLFFPIAGVRDYTCGFRLYRHSVLRKALRRYGDQFVEQPGFVCMAEILVKLSAVSARVGEVPLILRYDMKAGRSKMKVAATIGRYMVFIVRAKTRGLVSLRHRTPRSEGNPYGNSA